MPRYRVRVLATYTDEVVVEAQGPNDARRIALQGANAWLESSQSPEPYMEIEGEPQLEDQ